MPWQKNQERRTDPSLSKLGEISTKFEVKLTKSARKVEIDHAEPGETAPHQVSSITILSIGRRIGVSRRSILGWKRVWCVPPERVTLRMRASLLVVAHVAKATE